MCLQSGWGWRGCPRPPPVPTGRPTPMFDFFLTTPPNRFWSGSSPHPPCFLTGFRRRQRRRRWDCHTHTHMGHSLLSLALISPQVPYSTAYKLNLAQKLFFPWGNYWEFPLVGSRVNCVRSVRQGVPKRTAAADESWTVAGRANTYPGTSKYMHTHILAHLNTYKQISCHA